MDTILPRPGRAGVGGEIDSVSNIKEINYTFILVRKYTKIGLAEKILELEKQFTNLKNIILAENTPIIVISDSVMEKVLEAQVEEALDILAKEGKIIKENDRYMQKK